MIEPMPHEQKQRRYFEAWRRQRYWSGLTANQYATGMRRCAREAIQISLRFDPTAGRVARGLDDALYSPSLQNRYFFLAGKL